MKKAPSFSKKAPSSKRQAERVTASRQPLSTKLKALPSLTQSAVLLKPKKKIKSS